MRKSKRCFDSADVSIQRKHLQEQTEGEARRRKADPLSYTEPAILRRSVTSLSCGLADLCTSQSPVGDSTAGEQHTFLNKRTTKGHTRDMTQKSPKEKKIAFKKVQPFSSFSFSSKYKFKIQGL